MKRGQFFRDDECRNAVNALIQRKMLYEDRRGNVVFIGYDGQSKARFASVRGTYGDCRYRGDCAWSDKRYGFNIPCSTGTIPAR